MTKKILTSTFLILTGLVYLSAVDIKKESTIKLDQEKLIIQRAMSMVVIKGEQYLVLDYKAKNIKRYGNKGKFIEIWGKQGFGPAEFGKPSLLEYRDNLLVVGDLGKRKIFIFSDKDNNELSKIKEFYSPSIGNYYKIDGKKLLISGSKADKKFIDYELYLRDIENDRIDYLLLLWHKFGYDSYREYDRKYDSELAALSFNGFCDLLGNQAYFVWSQKLRIIRIDTETKRQFIFGHETDNYKRPRITKKMRQLYLERNPKVHLEDRKFSHITGLIAEKGFIALIYSNYHEQKPGWQYYIQFYSLEGKFLSEKEIPGAVNNDHFPLSCLYYNRNTQHFYFLSQKLDKDDNDIYHVIKYKLSSQRKKKTH
jgi:hypothetical protein